LAIRAPASNFIQDLQHINFGGQYRAADALFSKKLQSSFGPTMILYVAQSPPSPFQQIKQCISFEFIRLYTNCMTDSYIKIFHPVIIKAASRSCAL